MLLFVIQVTCACFLCLIATGTSTKLCSEEGADTSLLLVFAVNCVILFLKNQINVQSYPTKVVSVQNQLQFKDTPGRRVTLNTHEQKKLETPQRYSVKALHHYEALFEKHFINFVLEA